jgi:hypothetical protein
MTMGLDSGKARLGGESATPDICLRSTTHMNTDLEAVVTQLREIMHMLDERAHHWAAAALFEAIEELEPAPDMLPGDEDTVH